MVSRQDSRPNRFWEASSSGVVISREPSSSTIGFVSREPSSSAIGLADASARGGGEAAATPAAVAEPGLKRSKSLGTTPSVRFEPHVPAHADGGAAAGGDEGGVGGGSSSSRLSLPPTATSVAPPRWPSSLELT